MLSPKVKRSAARRDRKIIVSIATSADGYIARPDGGIEWLDRPRPPGNYGMGAFMRSIDAILWGRKTYEVALKMGGIDGGFGLKVKNYVFTHNPPQPAPTDVAFVKEPIKEFANRLRSTPGKDVWMMGGAGIIASFLDEGEIDEFIIHVIPRFIGDGIPLVQPQHRNIGLKLKSVQRYSDGVARLHYAVERESANDKAE